MRTVWETVMLLCALLIAHCVKAQCECDTPFNRAVLQDLYAMTNGPQWTKRFGWLRLDSPVCDWYGVSCAASSIDTLSLNENNLNGSLPKSLVRLTNVTHLDVSNNVLNGTLPAEWAVLTKLKILDVSGNNFMGTLPAEWAALTELGWLHVDSNPLTGTLPAAWSALTALWSLAVGSSYQLTGTLPPEWSALKELRLLGVSGTQVTGPLPPEWAAMKALQELGLNFNQLSGTLPAEWSALTALQYLWVGGNQLTGTLPAEWSGLTGLQQLDVSNNELTGTLPAAWSTMTALVSLYLSYNQLTGTLPSEWAAMVGLQCARLNNNRMSGCFDICILAATEAFSQGQVYAANNNFSGPFNFSCANATSDCSNLEENIFPGNKFCGSACGLPPCGNASCSATANTASSGPFLGTAEVSSQAACCAACSAHQQCVAAEWYAFTGVCILQSAIGATSPKPNVTLLSIY